MSDGWRETGNEVASPGHVYVCSACGKRSRDRYGLQAITPGWDESCMLHALLCTETSLKFNADGRVIDATASPRGVHVLRLVHSNG